MQKLRAGIFIAAYLSFSLPIACAEEAVDTSTANQPVEEVNTNSVHTAEEFDPSLSEPEYSVTETDDSSVSVVDMLSEIVIRPVSVAASVTGFVLFIVASPISGLASIPEPHDAFKTTWNDFVVTPYYFAFRRPLGDYSVKLNK